VAQCAGLITDVLDSLGWCHREARCAPWRSSWIASTFAKATADTVVAMLLAVTAGKSGKSLTINIKRFKLATSLRKICTV
jgi:hypothetical protein